MIQTARHWIAIFSLLIIAGFGMGLDTAHAQAFWSPVPRGLTVDLPAARADALRSESADALPVTAFYTAAVGPPGASGTLIRSEKATGYSLPTGIDATRIIYWSRAPTGVPVPVSAVVLRPAGRPPKSGWPLLAWAHGTSGAEQMCAPSLMRDLDYGWLELSNLLDSGYSVVATDYQGLGMPGRHPYLDGPSQALDVIASVVAARRAVSGLSTEWVAVGHSQGGLAAVAIGLLEARLKDRHYRGTLAVAGGWDSDALVADWGSPQAEPMLHGLLSLLATGIPAVEPSFVPLDLLTPRAEARWASVAGHCDNVHVGALFDLPGKSVLRADWRSRPSLEEWTRKTRLEGRPDRPMLIIASADDRLIPVELIDTVVRRLCIGDAPIEYRRFTGTGLDHLGVLQATTGLQLHWIADRFAGKPALHRCPAY